MNFSIYFKLVLKTEILVTIFFNHYSLVQFSRIDARNQPKILLTLQSSSSDFNLCLKSTSK